jgi:hypothetical protein
MVERTAHDIKQALDDLVKSDGWAIVLEIVEQNYGAEKQLADIDEAIRGTAPSDADAIGDVIVPQIRARARGARNVLQLVEHRRAQAGLEIERKPALADRFAKLRRV